MKVLITGSDGFIGKNLFSHLAEDKSIELLLFSRKNNDAELLGMISEADFIFHLAGINRPKDVTEFSEGNADFTQYVSEKAASTGRKIPIVYTSSIQADVDNPYGKSKADAERHLVDYSNRTGSAVYIYRLPNVFGKWAKPNYNSAVATFCYNICRDLPITVNDPNAKLKLVYIDDVIKEFVSLLSDDGKSSSFYYDVSPVYETTVGFVADTLNQFKQSRINSTIGSVGCGLVRALYSTYVSYLPTDLFSYSLVKHEDPRGVFVEMLKTETSGQFSFFTAHPGITRGGHYHHTKTEKFLVIKGKARFKFKHILTGEYYELLTDGAVPEIVETVPGWNHDITNIGDDEMIVMLWANEIFDRNNPDTFARPM